jgi:AcrR family transcriptional regulator
MEARTATRAERMLPAERYAQLLEAAEGLFVERGFAAVSMTDIAAAAGVTRPVVYDHFKSKEGAYLACVGQARASFEAELLRQIRPELSPREQLRAGGEAFFTTLARDPKRWQLLFGSNAVLPGEANQRLAAMRFATIEQIRLILVGMAPDAPAERIEACAQVVSGAGERLGHWWLTRPEIPRERIVDHYIDILWDGLRPYIRNA